MLVTLLAPAPGQETHERQGGQAAEDNTSNGAARQLGLIIHGHGALGRADNGGCSGGANDSGGAAIDSGRARDPGGGASNKGAADNSRSADPAGGAVDNSSSATVVGYATPGLGDSTSINVVGGGRRGGQR